MAARAATVAGVVRLDAGPFGTKSTYGSGGRIDGVTVKVGAESITVTVHIVVRFGERIPELASTVSREVTAALQADLGDAGPWDVGVEVVDVVNSVTAGYEIHGVTAGGELDGVEFRRDLR